MEAFGEFRVLPLLAQVKSYAVHAAGGTIRRLNGHLGAAGLGWSRRRARAHCSFLQPVGGIRLRPAGPAHPLFPPPASGERKPRGLAGRSDGESWAVWPPSCRGTWFPRWWLCTLMSASWGAGLSRPCRPLPPPAAPCACAQVIDLFFFLGPHPCFRDSVHPTSGPGW